jgi:DNA polymerase-3 subunit gamma/tau
VPAEAEQAPAGGLTLVDVRRLWPDIVEATKARRRVTWMHLTQHAQVVGVDATTLTLGFGAAGPRDNFAAGGHAEIVRQAAVDTVGVEWRIEAIIDPGADTGTAAPPPGGAGARQRPAETRTPSDAGPPTQDGPATSSDGSAVAADQPRAVGAEQRVEGGPGEQVAARVTFSGDGVGSAREAIQQTRPSGAALDRGEDRAAADADAHPDDLDAETNGLAGAELLQRELGARVIEEIPHQ